MTDQAWAAVDRYLENLYIGDDAALSAALDDSAKAGMPAIAVSPAHGKFLQLQVRALGARRVLEIGTLGAYSTIWMARALTEGGKIITLEVSAAHAAVAAANLGRAGCGGLVEIVVGDAMDSMRRLLADRAPPFDLIFIDADKEPMAEYFALAMQLARPGTVIIADNVVRDGGVTDPQHADPRVRGVRRFHEAVAAERRALATVLQTVGVKGYDGFTYIVVGA